MNKSVFDFPWLSNPQATQESNLLFLAVGIFILLVLVLVVIGWASNQRTNKAIKDLTKAVSNISPNNSNQSITTSGNKELQELSETINGVVWKINDSYLGMQKEAAENIARLEQQSKDLERVTRQTTKQANQFKALAFVARAILSIPNLDNLLTRIATVVSDTLSFYHMGIFLLDDAKEYAILTATNSSGGQRMMEHNHRLKVGEEGIVGYVAGINRPRTAVDTDRDGVFLSNPDLPETRSELAVPLKVGLDIIGVLDMQSKEPLAFSDDDIEFFSILADYISIAIQNARRVHEIQKTITESDTLYRNYLRQEWKSFSNQRRSPGYLYNISGSKPLPKKLETAEIQRTIQSGKPTITEEKNQSHLSVPIKLRGQVIGILNIQSGGNHAWEEDEIDIATAIADRVGLAVENARLLEDSQSRAARERTIGEITSRIGASINIRNVLQTAVEELGHVLPGSDVIIQLNDARNRE
jgi:GAF domain-containing protein